MIHLLFDFDYIRTDLFLPPMSIAYESFTLDNGLPVIVHPDNTTQQVVLNILFNVGSRDEDPDKTGFAHLFEHLMFGGSKNISNFDEPLQKVGGENNAFTTPDYTNYYTVVPKSNIETAFWLESDRMLSLSFDPKVLEVQRKVVIEEFKQRYLNQPYGDVWLKLRSLAYQKHPYNWPTIGKEISHIEEATMEDVREFFHKYYVPNNAVLVVAGNVTLDQVKTLSEKWFGPIPMGEEYVRNLPTEPVQTEARNMELSGNVPLNALYKVYHMADRLSDEYYSADLMSDILGRGKSSILYQSLVKEKKLFSKIGCYITGSIEPGLMVISGNLSDGVSHQEADEAIENVIERFTSNEHINGALDKVKTQSESSHHFSEIELLNRAINLAYFTLLGDTGLINHDLEKTLAVTESDILQVTKKVLNKTNCSTLYYHRK